MRWRDRILGVLEWDMSEPRGIVDGSGENIFADDNVALYGNIIATEAMHLSIGCSASSNAAASYRITDYYAPAPPISWYVYKMCTIRPC